MLERTFFQYHGTDEVGVADFLSLFAGSGAYEVVLSGFKTVARTVVQFLTAIGTADETGEHISDIVNLHFSDIIKDGERYRLSIIEQKTGKARTFTVPLALYQFMRCYCLDHDIAPDALIFPITTRAIQKQLKMVCDYLGFEGISTHSFRKFYATEIYKNSNYNIALVQQLLQHSSAAVTQRYIGIQQQEIERAIEGHLQLDV